MSGPAPARVTFNRAPDGVATLRMDDPEGRNALSEAFTEELLAALREAAEDRDVRVLVVEGRDDVFCAGASRELLRRLARREVAPTDIWLSKALLDVPVPTVAAMAGHAVGGGLGLGLCADIVVLARESRYGCPFMTMGFTPGMGVTRLLENVLSRAVAHELMYTGELRRGADFDARSGFNHIVPKAEVNAKAHDLAARIAAHSRTSLEVLKRWLSVEKRRAFEETRTVEALMHEVSFAQVDIEDFIENGYVE